jgi:hypothetical protein
MSDQATLEILISIRDELAGLTRTKQGIKEATDSAGGLGQALKTGFGISVAQKGLDLLTSSLKEYVVGAFDMAAQIKEQSANLSLSAESYQVLSNVITDAGGDVTQLSTALTTYQQQLNQARNGTGQASVEFRRLGLDVDQLSRMPLQLQLEEVARAMFSAGNETRAFDSGVQLLGARNAPRLMGALKELATEGYGKLADEMRDAGRVMTDDTVQRLAAAQQQIKKFHQEMAISIGEQIGATMEENPDAVKTVVDGAADIVKYTGQIVSGWRYIIEAMTTGKSLSQIGEELGDRQSAIAHRLSPPPMAAGPVMATWDEASQANLVHLQQEYAAASNAANETDTEQKQKQLAILQAIIAAEVQIDQEKYKGVNLYVDETTLTKAQLTQLEEKRKLEADIDKSRQEAAKLLGDTHHGETIEYRKIVDQYQHVNTRGGSNQSYMTGSEGYSAGAMQWVTSLGSEGQQAAQILNQTLGQTMSSLTNDIWAATKGTQGWSQTWQDLGDIAGRMLTEMLVKMMMVQAIGAVLGMFGVPSSASNTISASGTGAVTSAGGGSFVTNGLTHFTVGDNPGGVELVHVIPLSGIGRTSVSGSAAQIAMAGGGTALVAGGAKGAGDTYIIDARGADSQGLARLEAMIRAVNGSVEQRAMASVLDAQKRRRNGFV